MADPIGFINIIYEQLSKIKNFKQKIKLKKKEDIGSPLEKIILNKKEYLVRSAYNNSGNYVYTISPVGSKIKGKYPITGRTVTTGDPLYSYILVIAFGRFHESDDDAPAVLTFYPEFTL